MHVRPGWILAGLALAACEPADDQEAPPPPPPAQVAEDLAAAAPEQVRILLENEVVRVMEVRLDPQDGLPLHEGPPRVVYALEDARLRFVEESAEEETQWQAGDVHWHEAGQHSVANVGVEPARFLVVARTGSGPSGGGQAPDVQDPATDPGGPGEPLLENEDVRVTLVDLAPGESLSSPPGSPAVMYSLGAYALRVARPGGDPEERSFQPGDTQWQAGGEQTLENTGGTEARFLVFTFRR